MKYAKILGLLAVAAAALMAFAATASATTVTSGGVAVPTGTKIHAVSEGGHVTLHNNIAKIECASTAEGTITTNGDATEAASGPIETLIFGTAATEGCTGGWVVHVNSPGTLSIVGSGGGNGHLFSNGATVTATRFGIECKYATNNTTIGTVTAGEHATLDISASITRHGGSPLCGGSTAAWTGNYKVTTPTNLSVD